MTKKENEILKAHFENLVDRKREWHGQLVNLIKEMGYSDYTEAIQDVNFKVSIVHTIWAEYVEKVLDCEELLEKLNVKF